MSGTGRPRPPGLGYAETDARLAVRIRAHREFTNVQLEDWLADRLATPVGGRLLDVGCGDGNLFGVSAARVGPKGLIVGFDVSDSLLAAGRERARGLDAAALVFKGDFNQPFPLLDDDFDTTLSAYAAYYAADAGAFIDEVLRVTRPGGQVVLIGPTEDNAAELYDLNERVTGVGRIGETDYTTARLAGEFLPLLRERVGAAATAQVLDRRIDFPSAREYARYYQATWLYEKTCDRLGRSFALEHIERAVETHTLSKKVLVLEARA